MHLPRSQDQAGGREDRRVRPLRLPRLFWLSLPEVTDFFAVPYSVLNKRIIFLVDLIKEITVELEVLRNLARQLLIKSVRNYISEVGLIGKKHVRHRW